MLSLSPAGSSSLPPLVKNTSARGPGGERAHPPCKGYIPMPLAYHQAECHPCPSRSPMLGCPEPHRDSLPSEHVSHL